MASPKLGGDHGLTRAAREERGDLRRRLTGGGGDSPGCRGRVLARGGIDQHPELVELEERALRLGDVHAQALAARRVALGLAVLDRVVEDQPRVSSSLRIEAGESGTTRRPPLSEYEANATGRIRLELATGYGGRGRPSKWADRNSRTLEDKLPELLRELETRAAERRAPTRSGARGGRATASLGSSDGTRARERHAEHRRDKSLGAEVAAWVDAQQIRAYCDAAEAAYSNVPETIEWVTWARGYADAHDPLRIAPTTPSAPESVPAEDLRPFLDGWDPYGPERRRW